MPAIDDLVVAAQRAADWAGEPFLHNGEEPAEVLAPGTARRNALDEGVVASPKDIDTALILGAGFPFFMGGLTKHLEQAGYSYELSSSRLPSGSHSV